MSNRSLCFWREHVWGWVRFQSQIIFRSGFKFFYSQNFPQTLQRHFSCNYRIMYLLSLANHSVQTLIIFCSSCFKRWPTHNAKISNEMWCGSIWSFHPSRYLKVSWGTSFKGHWKGKSKAFRENLLLGMWDRLQWRHLHTKHKRKYLINEPNNFPKLFIFNKVCVSLCYPPENSKRSLRSLH